MFLTLIFIVLVALIFDWFVDTKLSIHFGGDKTTAILFPSEFKRKNI